MIPTILFLLAVLVALAFGVWASFGLIADKVPTYTEAARGVRDRLQAAAQRHDIPLEEAVPPLRDLGTRALSLLTAGFTQIGVFTETARKAPSLAGRGSKRPGRFSIRSPTC